MNTPKTILIVDDNTDLLDIMKINSESAGYVVHTSSNGLTGIVDILSIRPDIIILDIMMPEMNGFEVLRALKEQSSIRIPVIVCSNLGQDADIKKAKEYGADLFLQKSNYPGDALVKAVDEYLASVQ